MENDKIYIDLIDELQGYFSYKERTGKFHKDMKEKGSASVHIGYYNIDKTLERCYQFIAEQKIEYAFVQIIENIDCFIEALNTFRGNDLDEEEPVQFKIHKCLKRIKSVYSEWKEKETEAIANQFKGTWLFTEEELKDKKILDPRVIVYIENAIKKKLFKLYFYKQGEGKISRQTKFLIYPMIGISNSLEEWFSFIEKQNMDKLKDSAVVTLFLKLDYASEHFSSFVISIHQKDSIWIASDQIDFENPRNKRSARNPHRDKEKHYDNIGLPYELVFEMDKIRSEQQGLLSHKDIENVMIDLEAEKAFMQNALEAYKKKKEINDFHMHWFQERQIGIEAVADRILKERGIAYDRSRFCLWQGQTPEAMEYKREGRILAILKFAKDEETRLIIYKRAEIFQKKFTDVSPHDRMYFVKLIERFFEELEFDPPKERVMIAKSFVEQKLLEGGTFQYSDKGFIGFNEGHKEILDGIVQTVNSEERSLAVMSYDLVLKSPEYETSWLGTPAALENLAKWSILEDEAKNIKQLVKEKIKPRKEKDSKELFELLKAQKDRLIDIAFSGKKFYLYKFVPCTMKEEGKKSVEWIYLFGDGDKANFRMRNCYFNNATLFVDKWPYHEQTCQFCNDCKVKKEPLISFDISHYAQFMELLGITDRKQLPIYFQNYRSHDQIPYHGNSILDNVHPYSLINDPASRDWPNGYLVDIFMCKRCYNRLKKERLGK